MSEKPENFFTKRWVYPLVYIILIILNVLISPIASVAYPPQMTGDVIQKCLMTSIDPYIILAPVFHITTIVLVVLIWRFGERVNRILAAYIGVNYVFIAFAQMIGYTWEYGLVIIIGGLISYVILGFFWFWETVDPKNITMLKKLPWWRYWPIPLAILAFWAPISPSQSMAPDFNPLLLIMGEGYGLTFCMTTPVFLCLLTLFYPKVNEPVLRINSFVGILYGLYNMPLIFVPYTFWMGFLHIPLLSISIYAFILPWMVKE